MASIDYDKELDNKVKIIMDKPIIERIAELAYLAFTPSEIAIFCGFDTEDFQNQVSFKTTKNAKAYWVGKMRYKLKQRLTTHSKAVNGDDQAVINMQIFINKQKEEEDA